MKLREGLLAMLARWAGHSVVAENDYTEGVNDGYQECARDVRALLSTADSEQREVELHSGVFFLDRVEDEGGVSGTGRVAQGFVFDDGTAALRWLTTHRSTAFYESIEELNAIHGHAGKTKITRPGEQREWRGPVRCNKCSKVYATAPSEHYWSWNKHPYPRELCDGTFVPYERRSPTRPAEQQEVADLRRKLEEASKEAGKWRSDFDTVSLANAALRSALEKWGTHSWGCPTLSNRKASCMCGLDAALALPADSLAPEVVGKYNELLYSVETKYDGEDRHATALRYIKEAENRKLSGTCMTAGSRSTP